MKAAVLIAAVVVLGLAAHANAECANACSGHGTCGTKDQCTCYPNWQAADCSERTCPFGLAFVDTPQGDLNHDGSVADSSGGAAVQWHNKNVYEKYPNVASTSYNSADGTEEAHFYTECSNKGTCDRESGECQCLDGYEGSSCQRTSCPNSCSGHGVCRTMQEIAEANMTKRVADRLTGGDVILTGVDSAFTYDLWDKDKNQACVCDAGWSGFDCSLRECPRGDDPMTHRSEDCLGYACRNERQVITIGCADATCENQFQFHFRDWTGMDWTTNDMWIYAVGHASARTTTAMDTLITNELEGLPNGAIENVRVDVSQDSFNWLITINFIDNSGNQDFIECEDRNHRDQVDSTTTCTTTSPRDGNTEESPCSNRGLCDYETGVCKCFKGFYDDDCSVQHALAL